MSGYSTYNLDDFFLFSGQTLVRYFELYNLHFWPWQFVFTLIVIIFFSSLCSEFKGRDRVISGIIAFFWGWCGYAFHELFYSQINIVASYFALYFYTVSAIFLLFGSVFKKMTYELGPGPPYFYIPIIVYSFMALPLINILLGRELSEVLFFGWGCDETALGTLALTLLIREKIYSYILFALVLIVIIISLLTSYALNLSELYAYALGVVLIFMSLCFQGFKKYLR